MNDELFPSQDNHDSEEADKLAVITPTHNAKPKHAPVKSLHCC